MFDECVVFDEYNWILYNVVVFNWILSNEFIGVLYILLSELLFSNVSINSIFKINII
jgi:hypothetical protein